jgi:hypothetical protein
LLEHGVRERYRWVDMLANGLETGEKAKIADALEIMTNTAGRLGIGNKDHA